MTKRRCSTKEARGPKLQRFDEWMESFDRNLRAATAIQSFLLKEATAGRVKIGFHQLRDQAPLFGRLAVVGIRKGFFADRRQFLRDSITKKTSAFRSVIDLICIHGIHNRRERFWNGLGAESDAQLHLQSEVMFEISQVADAFVAVLLEDGTDR